MQKIKSDDPPAIQRLAYSLQICCGLLLNEGCECAGIKDGSFLHSLRLSGRLSTYDFAQGSAYQLVSFREVLPICGTLPLI